MKNNVLTTLEKGKRSMRYIIETQEHIAVEAENEEEAEAIALRTPRKYWEQSEFSIEEDDGTWG